MSTYTIVSFIHFTNSKNHHIIPKIHSNISVIAIIHRKKDSIAAVIAVNHPAIASIGGINGSNDETNGVNDETNGINDETNGVNHETNGVNRDVIDSIAAVNAVKIAMIVGKDESLGSLGSKF